MKDWISLYSCVDIKYDSCKIKKNLQLSVNIENMKYYSSIFPLAIFCL